MNAVMESCARLVGSAVLANTVYQSASRTPDIQHLVPLSTQPSVAALVGHPAGPHPHDVTARLGLGQPETGAQGPVADAGEVAPLLLLGAGDHDRSRGQPGQQEHQRRRVGVLGHFLNGHGQAEDAGPRPPELDRDAQSQQAGVAERLEDVGRVRPFSVDGPGPRFDLVLRQPADGISELHEFVGKFKLHR